MGPGEAVWGKPCLGVGDGAEQSPLFTPPSPSHLVLGQQRRPGESLLLLPRPLGCSSDGTCVCQPLGQGPCFLQSWAGIKSSTISPPVSGLPSLCQSKCWGLET